MKETANSKPHKAKNIEKGIKVNNAANIPALNIWYKNVDNIFNSVWPAAILANNLIPNENALAKYDTTSIRTNNGTSAKGVPEGTKYEKNFKLCKYNAKIVTPVTIVNDRPIVTITEVVIVYE